MAAWQVLWLEEKTQDLHFGFHYPFDSIIWQFCNQSWGTWRWWNHNKQQNWLEDNTVNTVVGSSCQTRGYVERGLATSCLESGAAQNSCAGRGNKTPLLTDLKENGERSCWTETEKHCVWDGNGASWTGVSSIRHRNKPSTFANTHEASAGVLCPESSMLQDTSRKMQPVIVRLKTLT